jgi:hypothetical protein
LAYSSHTQLSCMRAVSLLPLRECPRPARTRQARLCRRATAPVELPGERTSLKERAGGKRGFGLQFRGREAVCRA